MPYINFEEKFHGKRSVANSPLWESELGCLDREPPLLTTMPLFHLSFQSYCVFISNCKSWNYPRYISPPWGFSLILKLFPRVANTPNRTKTNHHKLNQPSFTASLVERLRGSLSPLGSPLVYTNAASSLPPIIPGTQGLTHLCD